MGTSDPNGPKGDSLVYIIPSNKIWGFCFHIVIIQRLAAVFVCLWRVVRNFLCFSFFLGFFGCPQYFLPFINIACPMSFLAFALSAKASALGTVLQITVLLRLSDVLDL